MAEAVERSRGARERKGGPEMEHLKTLYLRGQESIEKKRGKEVKKERKIRCLYSGTRKWERNSPGPEGIGRGILE